MKKIIGIFVIIVLAVVFSFNTNAQMNSVSNLDLADIISINAANAETSNDDSTDDSGREKGVNVSKFCLVKKVKVEIGSDGKLKFVISFTAGSKSPCKGSDGDCVSISCK